MAPPTSQDNTQLFSRDVREFQDTVAKYLAAIERQVRLHAL
jgi:hypothetical protein